RMRTMAARRNQMRPRPERPMVCAGRTMGSCMNQPAFGVGVRGRASRGHCTAEWLHAQGFAAGRFRSETESASRKRMLAPEIFALISDFILELARPVPRHGQLGFVRVLEA